MDVDVPSVEQNDDLIGYFALRAEDFAWSADVVEQIRARRAAMSGELFFDVLLKLGGIENPASLYPPVDVPSLQSLLDAVEHVTYDTMKRDCLVYYLLRWQMDGRESSFAEEKVISPHYVALADAYWYLDLNTNLGGAIGLLSDARIVKDYSSKILETLALSAESGSLIRKFFRTCRPALREQIDLERYLIATAEFSMIEAWQYQKTFPENQPIRKKLIYSLITWAFTPKPRQQALTQLLPLPFSKYEEDVLQDFAENPPESLTSTSVSVVRDMVCVRFILSCKYIDAVKFDRRYPSSSASAKGTWGAERSRIMAEILSVMPAAERALLEQELDGIPSSSSTSSQVPSSGSGSSFANLNTSTASLATDLSGSWEDVGSRRMSRHSFGARAGPARASRQSLANGFIPSPPQPNAFSPGPSTSTPRAAQPLSAHPTLVSQGAFMPSMGTPSGTLSSSIFSSSVASRPSAAIQSSAQRLPSAAPAVPKVTVNGNVTNGTPKTNAFMTRNAFFNPPEVEEPTEQPRLNGDARKILELAKKPSKPEIRLPTPPQEEEEQRQPSEPTREESQSVNGDTEEQGAQSEREDLGFSIFGNSAAASHVPPPKSTTSPKRMRKTRSTSARISVPGAFVSDEEHMQDLLSPKSATRTTTTLQEESISAHTRRSASASKGSRKNARKRAISPETSVDDLRISIPGTLYQEEDERSQDGDVSRAHTVDDERDEEADELAPLPTSATRGGRRKTASAASASGRRRSSRATSRASSAEPEETGPRRRSSRLSTTGSSATMEKVNEKVEKAEKKAEKKNTRPRKSTRTAGAGATATGRGAAKRK